VSVGRWFDAPFALLHRMRFLRGTPFHPFGYTQVRKLDRGLPDEYRTQAAQRSRARIDWSA
jgi:indolepyruvate ferredoxin oxidoreductase